MTLTKLGVLSSLIINMVLGKNKLRQKQYQDNCYTREEFYKIISEENLIIKSFDSGQKETFTDYSVSGDSIDYTIYNIFYPLPLVKEIYVSNFAGGWDHRQMRLHIEYWDNVWKLRENLGKEDIERVITKDEIFPEIFSFIEIIDESVAKKLLRNYNLSRLV